MKSNLPLTIMFLAYLAVLALIGYAAYRRTTSAASFILGDRRLPHWLSALSAGASDMSGWLLLGLPGLAYLSFVESAWLALGLMIGTYLNWRLVAKPLRQQSEHYGDALTIPEFLATRFDDTSGLIRYLSASCILLFFLIYTSAGLVAGGKLFATVFGLDYGLAVILGATVIVLYTSFGGFLAVSWTDAFQASLILIALCSVPVLAQLSTSVDVATLATMGDRFLDTSRAVTVTAILSSLAWGLGYFGQPHILARFMAIKHPADIPIARRIATCWTGIALAAAIIVGASGHIALETTLVAADSERVFIYLVQTLMPPLVAGLCLAAILAAIMSSADSQLLVASAALVHDILPILPRTRARSAPTTLTYSRAAVVMICVIATALALDPETKVLDLVAYAWAGFGASIGPCVLLSLYWPSMTRNAALAGLLGGAMTVIVWHRLEGGIFDVYELLPGFVVATLLILGVGRAEIRIAKSRSATA
jgi:sodium/proline symporter